MLDKTYIVNKGRAISTKVGIKKPGDVVTERIVGSNFKKLVEKKWIIEKDKLVVKQGENIDVAKPDIASDLEEKRPMRVLPKVNDKKKDKKKKKEKEPEKVEEVVENDPVDEIKDEEPKEEVKEEVKTQFGAVKKEEEKEDESE